MRRLKVLHIKKVAHLCRQLHLTKDELDTILENLDGFYRTRSVTKNGKTRLLCIPEGLLKGTLKRLNGILQRLEFPDYVHGGIAGFSPRTNATPHVNKPIIVKSDIKDFFPSITHERVLRLFRIRLQCSDEVAEVLAMLTTYKNSLPQGSPTSTVVATLVAEHLGFRLSKLARTHGASFTQYIDDMTMSGPSHLEHLKDLVRRIIEDEGFTCHPEKLCALPHSDEQVVTGVRVNQGIDAPLAKIRAVQKEIRDLNRKNAIGVQPTNSQLISVKGKIAWITQLNRGAGNLLLKEFERI